MDLSFTDEQESVRTHLAHLLQREVPLEAVRKAEPSGFSTPVWDRLVDMGIPGMGAPAGAGGGGADLTVLAAAAEELGKSLVPAPIVEHQVASRVLSCLAPGHPELSAVVAGTTVAAFAPRAGAGGMARLIPGGAVAGLVVALDGSELVAVADDPPADPPATLASAPVADRVLDNPGRVVLAIGPAARAAHQAAADEWRILTAASLVGLAAGALDLAVAYVKERTQFGVPVGSFQAVQHGLAEIPGQIDGARLLVHEAAWSVVTGQRTATGAGSPEMAAMAFIFAGEVARQATAACVQYHGGYGYAEEYDPQLFYRRARGWPLVLGDPADELEHLADALLGPRRGA